VTARLFAGRRVHHLGKPSKVLHNEGVPLPLGQAQAREARKLPGNRLAVRADSARDLGMGRRGGNPRARPIQCANRCEPTRFIAASLIST
jgi:hypothetical protein